MYNIPATSVFTKEQKLAFHEFMLSLSNWRTYFIPQIPHFVPPTDTKYITPQVTKRIVFNCEPYWKWNRGNEIEVPAQILDFKISFVKYNSRSKQSNKPHPGYKIWIFYIHDIVTFEDFSFIWCVNGNNNSSIPTFNEMYATCSFSEILIEKLNKFTGLSVKDNEQESNDNEQDSNDNTDTTKEMNIDDYKFLKDFIPPNLAKEFGWNS